MGPVIETIIALLITALMGVLIYFFVKLIRREKVLEEEDYLLSQGLPIKYEHFVKFINKKVKSRKNKSTFTLFEISLSNFEHIEETYGYEESQKILNQIQIHIRNVLPALSIVSGGNLIGHIFVYVPQVLTPNESLRLAKRIKRSAEVEIKIFEEISVRSLSTISYVSYPLNGNNTKELLSNLNLAIYLGEKSGGDRISPYLLEMQRDKKFIDQYYEIKDAISNRQFLLYYQPIVDNETNQVVGVESLIRWNHPTKGVLSPATFMPMLESSGDINWIGFWSLNNLIIESRKFRTKFGRSINWHLNISHIQLLNDHLVNEFQKIINKTRANPSDFVIEIVDFEAMLDHEKALKTLIRLTNLGFKIAISIDNIDYQSLTEIVKHKINFIKLHNNLLNDSEETVKKAFLDTVKKIASDEDIEIIVESVENEEDMQKSKSVGFNYNQGYYYSKPMNIDDFFTDLESK